MIFAKEANFSQKIVQMAIVLLLHLVYFQQMREFVSKEVAEFLKFAQNAARSCTKDYDSISAEALVYTKVIIVKDCFATFSQFYSCSFKIT